MLYDPIMLVQSKARFYALRFGLHPQVFAPSLMRASVLAARSVVELGYGVYQVGRSVVDSYRGICFCQAWRRSHRPCRHMLAVMLRSSCKPWDLLTGPAPEVSYLTCKIHGKRGTWEIIDRTPAGLWECVHPNPRVWTAYVQADQIYNVTPVYKELQ
jgi:hypothetical protein